MARTLFFPKDELRRRLRAFRLDELRVADITSVFDKNNRHIDVISFVIMLERYGVPRSEISSFLHDIGVDESTLINIFSKADFTRLGEEVRLIEAGGALIFEFLAAGLVDEMHVTLCPVVIGGVGAPSLVDGEGFSAATMRRLALKHSFAWGDELYLRYGINPG